jgi:LacI family transcriptional regulator
MRVTMRDVARVAGVSIQTVSAVLNGKPGISGRTADQVRAAIAALGYQPNLLASSLRSRRSTAIGLLLPNVANAYFAEIARGVEDVAQARGYSVMLCNHDDEATKKAAYIQLLRQFQVAGIIGTSMDDMAARRADSRSSGKLSTFPYLVGWPIPDDRRGGYVATAHLLDLGHRRIGCVTGPLPHGPGGDRLLGFRQALADWSAPVDEALIVEGAFDFASGRQAARVLLERGTLPTAIFVHNDLMAIGVIVTLTRAGLHVPDDVAVIGYDGAEIASLYDPPLSTVAQPTYELGAHAMTALSDQIEGRVCAVDSDVPDCELIVRRSTVPGLDGEYHCGPIGAERPWSAWREEKEVLMS